MKIHCSDMDPRIKTTHIFLGRSLFFRGEKSNLSYLMNYYGTALKPSLIKLYGWALLQEGSCSILCI